MRLDLSIARRLTIFITLLIFVIIILAGASVLGLYAIDAESETLERDTLVSTQILGELDANVSKFRVAEEYRAVAKDADAKSVVGQVADSHRARIEALRKQYQSLQAARAGNTDLEIFDRSWNAYMAEHDAWVAGRAAGGVDDPAQYLSSLHELYVVADDAVDDVIAANTRRGDVLAAAVDSLVHETIVLIVALSIGGVIVALLLLARVKWDITAPMSAITAALTALAGGNRNTVVPSRNRHDEIGRMVGAFEVFRANAFALEQAHEATRLAQEHAQALARHDPLTGLSNRRVFETEINHAVSRALQDGNISSLLMIDLDRFKPVNDQLGHPAGDLVLCEVSRRLTALIGEDDAVARIGGDEFAIITTGQGEAHAERLAQLASRVLEAMRAPMNILGNTVQIGATVGIASCPTDGADKEILMRAADLALYRAKREGRGRLCYFDRGMEAELQDRALLEADLRAAIAAGDIRPRYQPLVNMRDNAIYGFDVQAHWQHPTRGAMPSKTLVDLAGHLGLLSELTWPMLRQACRDAQEWPPTMILAVNLSSVQFRDPALPAQILTILTQENIAPSRLEIEVMEAAFTNELEPAELILAAMQSAGIRISLGDFGIGYSSLCGLTKLRFDRVKIDQSIVQVLKTGTKGEDMVGTVISMATSLASSTAAEGVDTVKTAATLSSLGCDLGQGFLFGRATAADGIKRLLWHGEGKSIALPPS
jgi:diguanylate cyclase (GGDEF)-like protein